MTQDTHNKETTGERGRVAAWTAGIVLTLVLVWLASFSMGGGVAVAQDYNDSNISNKSPYYANESTDIGMDAWLNGTENATLDDMVGLLMRVGPVVIGTGPMAPGGIGHAGGFVLALLTLGVVAGAIAGTGMGMVAAAILVTASIAVLVSVGLAPGWLWLVVLIGIGGLAYRALHAVLS